MSQETPLAALLAARIAATGPISLAEYMADCLLHPAYGYYATRDPFGRSGDFITAPEISQMFGEMLGLALAQYWLDLGAPSSFTLAEIGPGRGTLMADVLRVTARVPGFHDAARLMLVEASATLRQVQAKTLSAYQIEWADQIEDLPEAPLFLLANEFFDALPIRQFSRKGAAWVETMIGLTAEGRLSLGQGPATALPALQHRLADVPEGGVVEICPAAAPIMAEIAARIGRHGGLALIVDYGGWRSMGDTFQALKDHAFTDPLLAPGEADLTAHVDFEALARAASPAAWRYTTQAELLTALGIKIRAEALAKAQKIPAGSPNDPLTALHRLTDPSEMGSLFKALAVFPPDAPPPPGFPLGPTDPHSYA